MARRVSYFALWLFEQEENIMGKVAKGKEKTHDKKVKLEKMPKSKTKNLQTA